MSTLALVLLTVAHVVHGGAPYRGPGESVPPPPREPQQPDLDRPVELPRPGELLDHADWSRWWAYNQARYLDLKVRPYGKALNASPGGAPTGLDAVNATAYGHAPTPGQLGEMVDALHDLEARSEDRDVDSATMMALARIGLQPERARTLYARHLDSPHATVRETAVLAYGVLGDTAAYPLLRGLLLDDATGRALQGDAPVAPRMRAAAACALALIADADREATLRSRITADLLAGVSASTGADANAHTVGMACMVALGRFPSGDPAALTDVLLDLQGTGDLPVAVAAHLPGTLARLCAAIPEERPSTGRATALLLAMLAPDSESPVALRRAATLALGAVAGRATAERHPAALEALTRAAREERDVQARRYACMAIADLAIASRDATLRGQAIDFLVARMKRSSTADEPWAGLALGVLGFETWQAASLDFPRAAALAAHAKFLETNAPTRKACYALVLGLLGHHEAGDDIAAAMRESPDRGFRGHAAVALGLLGAAGHREMLLEQLSEVRNHPEALERTAVGLARMHEQRVGDALLGMLRVDEDWAGLAVFSSATFALGRLGDRAAVATLIEAAEDASAPPLRHAFVAVALGMIGDKDDLPYAAHFAEDLDYRADAGLLYDPEQQTGILDLR